MLNSAQKAYIIHNDQVMGVMKNLHSYKETKATLLLLQILALGEKEINRGETVDAGAAIEAIRQRLQQSVVQS